MGKTFTITGPDTEQQVPQQGLIVTDMTTKTLRSSSTPVVVYFLVFILILGNACARAIPSRPTRPERFHSVEEFQNYLQELRDYYAVLGRPRFGRSVKRSVHNNEKQQHSFSNQEITTFRKGAGGQVMVRPGPPGAPRWLMDLIGSSARQASSLGTGGR